MRAIWTGAVSFGLVNVPVRLYAATASHDIRFHQVHEADGGRIRQKRTCSVCGEEVEYSEIAKGYESEDGQLIMLDDDDLATLPVATGHEIDVVQFVPSDQVDALLLDKSYYLEPENKAVKPYTLLREALRATDRMAVVKVALRQRETLALLRVRDEAIVLQTMLWPDEVREPEFESLRNEVDLRPQEMQMASSLVESLSGDFEADQFEDDYRQAVADLIEYKREHGGGRPAPEPVTADTGDDMTDLLTALRRSVEAAGGKPAETASSGDDGEETGSGVTGTAADATTSTTDAEGDGDSGDGDSGDEAATGTSGSRSRTSKSTAGKSSGKGTANKSSASKSGANKTSKSKDAAATSSGGTSSRGKSSADAESSTAESSESSAASGKGTKSTRSTKKKDAEGEDAESAQASGGSGRKRTSRSA